MINADRDVATWSRSANRSNVSHKPPTRPAVRFVEVRSERAFASEPRERSEPAKRRARERVRESEGRSPSDQTSVLRTVTSAGEHQHHRIASLQLRQRAAHPAVVLKLVIGKHDTGNDVSTHRPALSTLRTPSFAASSGVFPFWRATM